VKSITLDEEKGMVTITGSADAVEVVEKLRKAKICAKIMSLGPEKKEEKKVEKKEEKKEEKKDDDKKKIECVPVCHCNCIPCYCYYKQPYICPPVYGCPPTYGYGPRVVYHEQYSEGNCVIS
jgi:hypothetical protein